ncbi:MAG: holo-ACP synthase, partial [Candidatus Dormibacteraeota bacterium]|nr:holo-ACP synthase [Candidatus Dormibacteraeota bacterium]MBO0760415.1 holo-ACP synthase [Candidatus Dormibacteraeota bacterium]
MLRRIGIDTCGLDRMATAVARSGQPFLEKVFTPAELAYCEGRVERLAGRWAAKEAIIKCFDGTPLCFRRREIEVLPAESGAPRVRLGAGGGGDSGAGGAQVQLTITHQSGLAVAAAALE